MIDPHNSPVEDDPPSAEVVSLPRRKIGNAYEQAKQELASFKFALYETVAADPLLRGAPCLNLIAAYIPLITIDKKTLLPTTAYASNSRVYVRAGLKCHKTAARARKKLEDQGYLVPVGSTNGMTVYRLENPHQDRVLQHVLVHEEYNRELRSDQKRNWNETKQRVGDMPILHETGMGEMPTPENDKVGQNTHPRVGDMPIQGWEKCPPITFNKYLSEIPHNMGNEEEGSFSCDVERGICEVGTVIEGEASEATKEPARTDPEYNQHNKKNSYAAAKFGELESSEKIDPPKSEKEADAKMRELFGACLSKLHPNITMFARKRLMNGSLEYSWVQERISKINDNPMGDA